MLKELNCWKQKKVLENEHYDGENKGANTIHLQNQKGSIDDPVESKPKKGGPSLNPITCMRTLVSKKKDRLLVDGFNLDMTYITNYVVAMGFPSDGAEKMIRNSRDDVIKFFKNRHGVQVKVYNLCRESSKQYSPETIPEFGY